MTAFVSADSMKELLLEECARASVARPAGDLFENHPLLPALWLFALQAPALLSSAVCSGDAAMTGLEGSTWSDERLPFRFGRTVHPACFELLGLQGHDVSQVGETLVAQLAAAVAGLDGYAGSVGAEASYAELVRHWVSLVVRLRPAPGAPSGSFASSAFPQMLGCVFVTALAAHHVPPVSTWRAPFSYALQENLVHEALHHQLGAALLARRGYLAQGSARAAGAIFIPWRDTHWCFEQALHALYVYQHVRILRGQQLARLDAADPSRAPLVTACDAARACSAHLRSAVAQVAADYLSHSGLQLLDEILSMGSTQEGTAR